LINKYIEILETIRYTLKFKYKQLMVKISKRITLFLLEISQQWCLDSNKKVTNCTKIPSSLIIHTSSSLLLIVSWTTLRCYTLKYLKLRKICKNKLMIYWDSFRIFRQKTIKCRIFKMGSRTRIYKSKIKLEHSRTNLSPLWKN